MIKHNFGILLFSAKCRTTPFMISEVTVSQQNVLEMLCNYIWQVHEHFTRTVSVQSCDTIG